MAIAPAHPLVHQAVRQLVIGQVPLPVPEQQKGHQPAIAREHPPVPEHRKVLQPVIVRHLLAVQVFQKDRQPEIVRQEIIPLTPGPAPMVLLVIILPVAGHLWAEGGRLAEVPWVAVVPWEVVEVAVQEVGEDNGSILRYLQKNYSIIYSIGISEALMSRMVTYLPSLFSNNTM